MLVNNKLTAYFIHVNNRNNVMPTNDEYVETRES